MFGLGKRERADSEIKEITTWILGQSVVHGSNFPPDGVFETKKPRWGYSLGGVQLLLARHRPLGLSAGKRTPERSRV
jgi:hypothetical protein